MGVRQQILVLYLSDSALDAFVVSWSFYDGTGGRRPVAGEEAEPPYKTGLQALKDGWRCIQFPQLVPPYPGEEFSTSFQKHEFIFEKLVETSDEQ